MNVVFLDFDGVLNSHEYFERRTRSSEWSRADDIDRDAVARLQLLCDAASASIVISSTWRLLHRRVELCDLLRAKGLTAKVLDKTPELHDERGHEIQAWLDNNAKLGRFDVTGIVILDDNSDMAHLRPWLVQTSFATGLTDACIVRARDVLRAPMPEVCQ